MATFLNTLNNYRIGLANNPALLSALVACCAVIVTSLYYIRNLKLTRLSNTAKMLVDLTVRFNSDAMRKSRSELADELINHRESVDLLNDKYILDFFEEIGYLVRRKALDRGMVLNSFFWAIEYYYLELRDTSGGKKDLIKAAREKKKSRAVFCELQWLFKKLRWRRAWQELRLWYKPLSASDIERGLNNESDLVPLAPKNKRPSTNGWVAVKLPTVEQSQLSGQLSVTFTYTPHGDDDAVTRTGTFNIVEQEN